jgi:hypothetical protein
LLLALPDDSNPLSFGCDPAIAFRPLFVEDVRIIVRNAGMTDDWSVTDFDVSAAENLVPSGFRTCFISD